MLLKLIYFDFELSKDCTNSLHEEKITSETDVVLEWNASLVCNIIGGQ